MDDQVYCECQGCYVEAGRCDRCDLDDDGPYDDHYVEPPLYPAGKLAGMSIEELTAEIHRQGDIQGRLGDAEHIDQAAVERTESRWRLVDAEIKRRRASQL